MKSSLLLLAALALLASPARAEKLEQWYKLLPKNTVGLIAIKDSPELIADWDKSGIAKLMDDPEFKKWTAPMMTDGKAPWDKFAEETSGESFREMISHTSGSALIVFAADSPADFEGEQFPFAALSEVGDKQKEIEEAEAREADLAIKKNPELKLRTREIAGVQVNILSESDEPDAKWESAWVIVDGVLVEAFSTKLFEYFISALKTGTAEASEVVSSHLARHAQLTDGTTDIAIYTNGEVLMKWLQDGLSEAMKGAKSQMPMDPKMIFEALGTRELQSIGVGIDLSDSQSRVDVSLLHPAKPTGFLSLFRSNGTEVALPSFIPADALAGQVSRQSLGDVWDGLLGMVNKLGPLAMMATMQVGQIEQQMGFKIKEDLFGSLSDEIVQASDGSATAQSQVFGIKVKDRAKLAGALDGLKRFIGQGFGAAFEESDYLGYTISTYKASQAAAAGAASNEIGYCLTDDYLIFSTGKQELLKKVLGRMKEPSGPSIWESARTQDLIGMLPKGYSGVGVSDASKQILLVVDAMTAVQKQAAGKKKAPAAKKGPGKGPKAGGAESPKAGPSEWFDPEARPSEDTFKKYLGTEVSGTYSHPEAVHFRMLSKPVE